MGIFALYVASNKFKVAGDRTSEFRPGRRVKANMGEDGVGYFTVKNATYTNMTIVTVVESGITPNLEEVLYSVLASGEKGGLPLHDHTSEDQGGYTSRVVANLFEVDINDDLMPSVLPEPVDVHYELDENDDIMPRAA